MGEADKKVLDAYRYAEKHQDVWEFVCRCASKDHRRGIRISLKWIVEQCRRELKLEGDPVGIPNALTPCFARMLLRQHPEYAGDIETARSELDEVFADEGRMRAILKEARL